MTFFPTISLPVKRPTTNGAWRRGQWIDASLVTPFSIMGSVQPSDGKKLAGLLEGKRLHAVIEIITDSELIASDPETKTIGDIVTYDKFDWEIIQVLKWENGILPHFEAFAIREKEGD
jgi:hypothetical protein